MLKPVEDAAQAPYGLRTQRRIRFDDKTLSIGTFERFHWQRKHRESRFFHQQFIFDLQVLTVNYDNLNSSFLSSQATINVFTERAEWVLR